MSISDRLDEIQARADGLGYNGQLSAYLVDILEPREQT